MIRFIVVFTLIIGWGGGLAIAETSNRVQGVRIFLNQGNPEQAIQMAAKLLASPKLSEEDRLELLKLIAEAEEFRATAGHFQDVSTAVNAINTVLKEFPDRVDQASFIWRIAWLYWKRGADKLSLAAARDITERFRDTHEAINAWMLMARIHINLAKFDAARNDLLQHGLRVNDDSVEQLVGLSWIAVIDYEERRFSHAYAALEKVYLKRADVIESEERLFATYIRLLHRFERDQEAMSLSDQFLKQYVKGFYVPHIRLLHADILAQQPDADLKLVEKEYEKISIAAAESTVGKKAFMRKLMFQYRDSKAYMELKPVIIALKRVASQNQLSEVENESILYQARIWVRVARNDPEHTPRQATTVALENYARVTASPYPELVEQALQEGKVTFQRYIGRLIDDKKWMQTVVIWERFPQLRPAGRNASQLQFSVAHALRMLMEYEQSEAILSQLYEQASGSVWGHKVMLEQARLWLDRGDVDGVNRVMKWLSEHEFTLYRPEMLLIVARMQLKRGSASSASQTMASVSDSDIAIEERDEYWKTQAHIAEKLARWHVAAHAWRQYGESEGADKTEALIEQANMMFKAKDYIKAEALYEVVPEAQQTSEWRYRFSVCQMHTGKRTQAIERLEKLKTEKDAGIYASLAALALAERQADELLESH